MAISAQWVRELIDLSGGFYKSYSILHFKASN